MEASDDETWLKPDVAAYFEGCFGKRDMEALRLSLGQAPMQTTLRVNTLRTDAATALVQLQAELAPFNDRLVRRGCPPVVAYIHPALDDIIVIPSAPPAAHGGGGGGGGGAGEADAAPAASAKGAAGEAAAAAAAAAAARRPVIVVDRLCGEAVLRGADVFAKGILATSRVGVEAGAAVDVYADTARMPTRRGYDAEKLLRERAGGELGVGDRGGGGGRESKSGESKGGGSKGVGSLRAGAAAVEGDVSDSSDSSDSSMLLLTPSSSYDHLVYLGEGEARMHRGDIFRAESGLGLVMTAGVHGDAPPLNGVLPNLLLLQNWPCAMAIHWLGPKRGERVMDLCASPGNKVRKEEGRRREGGINLY
jgi:hypothetical protein